MKSKHCDTVKGKTDLSEIFIEAESLSHKGGWTVETQSMETIGSAYLMAHEFKQVLLPTGAWNTDLLRRETYFNFDTGEGSPHIAENLLNIEPAREQGFPSVDLLASYVEAGLGISVVPSPDRKHFGPKTRAYRIPDSQMHVAAVRLVQSNSPALRNFFSMLKEIPWES